jgi:hypothetical protein
MTPSEWAAVGAIILSSLTAAFTLMRFMVKAIMRELLPNGGTSLKDQVNRIEARLDSLMEKLLNDTP